jgi:hypothetical protein
MKVASPTENLAVTRPDLAREYSSKNRLPADNILAGTRSMLRKIAYKQTRLWPALECDCGGYVPNVTINGNRRALSESSATAVQFARMKRELIRYETIDDQRVYCSVLLNSHNGEDARCLLHFIGFTIMKIASPESSVLLNKWF